jgi:uncharacterized membrane protein
VATFHLVSAVEAPHYPGVRRVGAAAPFEALRRGFADFWERPSHYVFLCLIYPVVGVVIGVWTSRSNVLPLLYPMMAGFALIGPFAAIGLYEISRRRERGLDSSWRHAINVLRSPALGAIGLLAVMLLVIFTAWLVTAQILYERLFGASPPASIAAFAAELFATPRGWMLIIAGNAIGFGFALLALCTTVVAFPLLLDREVGVRAAIVTSLRVVLVNPVPMAIWGLIVAAALVIGTLPFFIGLALVLPILGHSTWHLYRAVVDFPPAQRWERQFERIVRRGSAAHEGGEPGQ